MQAFRIAAERATLVLVTGGLGPTQDDLTREALAQAAGVGLVFDPTSFAQIEEMFARRKRTMPERNRVQAMFPEGAEPIANSCGTAPGFWMTLGSALFAAMPGVPSEMYVMFDQSIRPRLLQQGFSGGVLLQRKINCFGAGESAVEEKLFDLTRRGHEPEVGITVSDATISLRILARAASAATAREIIEPVELVIRERLGELVLGVEDEDLQDAVARLLAERRKSLVTAESVTGGLIAERLVQVPGISAWFRGGIVAYDNRIKTEFLGVPEAMIAEHGAVSGPVAEAMAIGVRQRLRADIAVSTTGIAGPGGGTPEKPVGMVWVGLAWEGGSSVMSHSWAGTRTEVRSRTAKMALNRVRLHLRGA